MRKKLVTFFSIITTLSLLVSCSVLKPATSSDVETATSSNSVESTSNAEEGDSDSTETCLHVYDNACDETCNSCGAVRTPLAHVYNDKYDATCNECGAERSVPEDPVNGGNWTGEVPLK